MVIESTATESGESESEGVSVCREVRSFVWGSELGWAEQARQKVTEMRARL